jgi:TonB family protein
MNRGDGLARWLVQQAARSAPDSLSERLEEEWLADLEARNGLAARLRFGVGCCWATRVIAYEHAAASVPAAASTTGSKTMTAYVQQDDPFFSRRTVTVLAILGLHVAIIYAFATGLGSKVIHVFEPPFDYVSLPDVQTNHVPPPLPPAQTTDYRKIDIPEVPDFNVPVDTDSILQVTQVPVPPALYTPPTVTKTVARVVGGPGKGFPNTEDFYPAADARLGHEGVVTVNTCVDERGRLAANPTVVKSSGTGSLDEGALRLAKAGSGHYRPSTEDGHPVSACYDYRIAFRMLDRSR